MTATNMTALAGTFVGVDLRPQREPGIAPSRLNANVIRDALVRQAVVQKSWPNAEMRDHERVRSPRPEGLSEDHVGRVVADVEPSVTACWSCTANSRASSRIQPPMAE